MNAGIIKRPGLSLQLPKHHKIGPTCMNYLQWKWDEKFNKIVLIPQTILTFSKLSLVQRALAKPWMSTELCVYIINAPKIRCVLIGNRYQTHWHNVSLNTSNRLFTNWPNSVKMKTIPSRIFTNANELNRSTKFSVFSYFIAWIFCVMRQKRVLSER